MKIDHDYLKKLLETFEAAPAPIFDISELQAAGLDYDTDQFVFHMGILVDQGFVERDDRQPGFGLIRGIDGHMGWEEVPLRLTARGHQFIEALRNKEVWATLKRDFKDASVNTLWGVSKLDFGQNLNGLAIDRGAKHGVDQFLYGHGQAETARKIAVVSACPANVLSPALSKLAKVELRSFLRAI